MVTSRITADQIRRWQRIYAQYGGSLEPNRISGETLDAYFRAKYSAERTENEAFRKVVLLNAGYEDNELDGSAIAVYTLENDVYVGIDLLSGFFQVECEDVKRMAAIWDDLFVTRGLSAQDLKNYVLTAQYILLVQEQSRHRRNT